MSNADLLKSDLAWAGTLPGQIAHAELESAVRSVPLSALVSLFGGFNGKGSHDVPNLYINNLGPLPQQPVDRYFNNLWIVTSTALDRYLTNLFIVFKSAQGSTRLELAFVISTILIPS